MNKAAAKAKIRSHLKANGENYCYITDSMAKIWWRILNAAIFSGKMPEPKRFELRNFNGGILGRCRSFGKTTKGDVVIGLRREYDSRNTFLTVLTHEMVHQYQWWKYQNMHHGITFYDWQRRVKQATMLPLNEYVEV